MHVWAVVDYLRIFVNLDWIALGAVDVQIRDVEMTADISTHKKKLRFG